MLLSRNSENCTATAYSRCLEQQSKDYKEIKKDVDRTLISHPYFQVSEERENGLGQIQLTRLLNAVVNAAKSIGYCQGMNYLGGTT